jgi:uncharacterized protein YneF (UPF0154 family)
MKNLTEIRQFLEKQLINKKNQNKEFFQTFIVVIFMITIMAFLMYFEMKFFKPGNLQAIIVALTGGLIMLTIMLISTKIGKKPFGHNPIITEQEIKILAKETLEKSNKKLNEMNEYVQHLKILAI